MTKDAAFFVSTVQLAQILNVSQRRVNDLGKQGMPRVKANQWDLREVLPWLRERWEARDEGTDMTRARMAEISARTKKHQLDYEVKSGRLIRYEDCEASFTAMCGRVTREFEALPSRLHLEGGLRERVSDECRAARLRIAEFAAESADALRHMGEFIEDSDAATEEDGG